MRIAATAAALLAAAVAQAQEPLPSDVIPAEQRARFQLCRAAVFYHLAAPERETALPHAFATTLQEQIAFVMFETVRNAPAGSIAESKRALGFVESFFIGFSETLAQNRVRLTDPEERVRTLIDCQPFVWMILSDRIDYLILWRERAIDPPNADGLAGAAILRRPPREAAPKE